MDMNNKGAFFVKKKIMVCCEIRQETRFCLQVGMTVNCRLLDIPVRPTKAFLQKKKQWNS